jgi:hypothetical protein
LGSAGCLAGCSSRTTTFRGECGRPKLSSRLRCLVRAFMHLWRLVCVCACASERAWCVCMCARVCLSMGRSSVAARLLRYFGWVYYVSVPATTARALLINDLQVYCAWCHCARLFGLMSCAPSSTCHRAPSSCGRVPLRLAVIAPLRLAVSEAAGASASLVLGPCATVVPMDSFSAAT